MAAFVALALATAAAFFVVQHLKVATPLINGFPFPFPRTINPVAGGVCPLRNGKGEIEPVSFTRMKIAFYLQNEDDDVNVWIVDSAGRKVRQIGDAVPMRTYHRHSFYWDGRLADGSVAPDGRYDILVQLVHQQATFPITNQSTGAAESVTVDTAVPHPVVTGVSPATLAGGASASVTIGYAGVVRGTRQLQILIYRLRAGRPPALVKAFTARPRRSTSIWNATIGGRLAPRGSYQFAVRAISAACTAGSSPIGAAAAPRAVVTIG
ncbi:MAG: FlgD immunoglobulin-like domain containing protein [Solirubrobacteraceae bacterium]